VASEVKGVRATAPDGTIVEVSGEMLGKEEPLGIVLERKLFDRQLAKDAARSGAHVMVRTRATGLILENGTVRGVKLSRLGEEFDVRAKLVIGADGVESQVGRWAGIKHHAQARDIESCAQYHMQNVELTDNTLDFYFGSAAPSGYAWAFPKGDGAANIGLGTWKQVERQAPVGIPRRVCRAALSRRQTVELMMGACPVSDTLPHTVSNGLMLVGDAAHHTDPITGGGIMAALQSERSPARLRTKRCAKTMRRSECFENTKLSGTVRLAKHASARTESKSL